MMQYTLQEIEVIAEYFTATILAYIRSKQSITYCIMNIIILCLAFFRSIIRDLQVYDISYPKDTNTFNYHLNPIIEQSKISCKTRTRRKYQTTW